MNRESTTHTVTGAPVARRESRALYLSMAGSGVLGALGVVWGSLTGSQIALFDGVVTLAGSALVLVSVLAARVAASGPSRTYPYGRHAATPLAVAVQGACLLGALAYGISEALLVIVSGGDEPAGAAIIVYGLLGVAGSLVMLLLLRPFARTSPLARAEVVSWRSGAALSAVVALGGVIAWALATSGNPGIARFLDPLLVLIASGAMIPLALGLVREGGRELLEAVPPAPLTEAVDRATDEVRQAHGLPAPVVRSTKLGRRLYVDVGFVVDEEGWDIADEDDLRRELKQGLRDALARDEATRDHDIVATLVVTHDPELLR